MHTKVDTNIQQTERTEVIESLYIKAFPLVARYISQNGGSLDEAKDIFQDALVIYFEKMYSGFVPNQSEKSYLLGITRNLWSKRFGELSKLNLSDNIADTAEDDYTEINSQNIMQLLSTAGKKCMELLSAFYYEKLDMEKLAGRFGFSGARSATVQKFKCLEKVKQTVKAKSLHYEDFTN
ncbi:sigma-70 family RNA polymerase sigma factor [Flavobacterium sp. LaA7.5]|nr:sigma-70 family RNA polymerase sigma factor [Flavobacterium salilacus subsp. altitudinum]